MTRLITPLAIAAVLLTAGWQMNSLDRYELTEGSTLRVEGTSTLHDWHCDATEITGSFQAEMASSIEAISEATVTVGSALDCGSGKMDRKAHEALKVKDNETITFSLDSAGVTPNADGGVVVQTNGSMTIAGTTKEFTTDVQGMLLEDGNVRLTGSFPIRMTEYDMDPPTALLGAIKTGDDVTVHFDFIATSSSNL